MKRRLVLGVLAVIAAAVPGVARALPPDTWLVAIANNTGLGNEVELLYAERDAREIASVMRLHGGVSTRHTLMLLDEDAAGVRRALQDVNAAIRARAGEGRPTALVVFYSGHADATSLHLNGTELSLDELKALVEGSPAGVRLLVVDACRSGTVTRVKGVSAAESFKLDLQDQVATEGLAIITSSAAGETSQESDRLRGSFFTHHLVNALRGAADQDGDGKVTLTEAYGYTYAQTLRSSGGTIALQHPTYSFDVKGRGELVLSTPAALQGKMGLLRLANASTYLVAEGREDGPIVAEVFPQADRRELALPAGSYFVQQRLSAEYREYDVKLEQGREVDLAALPFREIRYDRLVRRRGAPESRAQSFLLLGGTRGEMLVGQGLTPQLTLGWGMDLEWGSFGLRLRGMTVGANNLQGVLPRRDTELGLGLALQRFVDFRWFSLAFGLFAEGTHFRQTFETTREAPDRASWGAMFGGLLAAERHIGQGFALRLEGGPVTGVFLREVVHPDGQMAAELSTPLTFFLSAGIVWHR